MLTALVAVCVAACGGGGGSAPKTPAKPAQATDAPPVTIFAHPTPQEFVSVGASTTDGGDGFTPVSQDARLSNIFFNAADNPLIRYVEGGYYEIKLPGASYDRLVHYKGLDNPTADNNYFQPAGAAQNQSTFIISLSRTQGYNDSELASWTRSDNLSGYVAFGVPASASEMPSEGSVMYEGPMTGLVDITQVDNLYGGLFFIAARGTIKLSVDFATARVTGSVTIYIEEAGATTREIGTFPLVSASGLPGFSSLFETDQAGYNQFTGLFTGATGHEAIGNWALPIMIDGKPHQFIGAWIAKRE